MRIKKIIVGSVIIAVLGGAGYGYSEYNRKPKSLDKVKPHVVLSAETLIKDFETNEKDANSKYLDKIIAVDGKIRSVEKSENGYFTVVLGKEGTMSSVRCSMDSVFQQAVANLSAGSEIRMKGACTGFNADELLGSDVILNRCVVDF